jgi:hypothetical protein
MVPQSRARIFDKGTSAAIQRHHYRMKSRTSLYTLIIFVAIALGSIWFVYALTNQGPLHIFPATVNRDCAPWDGAAFILSFRYDPITTITVSIWQSPSLAFPVTFSFPDDSMRTGIVYSLPELDPLEELTGKVTFWHVEQGVPVEGEFDLTSARGERFKGKFIAEWGNEIVYCG